MDEKEFPPRIDDFDNHGQYLSFVEHIHLLAEMHEKSFRQGRVQALEDFAAMWENAGRQKKSFFAKIGFTEQSTDLKDVIRISRMYAEKIKRGEA